MTNHYLWKIRFALFLQLHGHFWKIQHIVKFYYIRAKIKKIQNKKNNYFLYFLNGGKAFSREQCDCTQCTPSVTSHSVTSLLCKQKCQISCDFLISSIYKNDFKDLTIFFPMFPFDPPENIRKRKVSWSFQGDQKGTLGKKELNKIGGVFQSGRCQTFKMNALGKLAKGWKIILKAPL